MEEIGYSGYNLCGRAVAVGKKKRQKGNIT
jgi:hypothetical protein